MMKLGLWLAEKGFIPDILLRVAIRKLSLTRLKDKSLLSEKSKIAASFKEGPIAEQTLEANEQHYEVPPSFFTKVLGKNLKYSCCFYETQKESLIEAEEKMLELYLSRAEICDGQNILDLGCGWGSFSLYAAKRFPNSVFTSISNSQDQINFINEEAKSRGLRNIKAFKVDINDLNLEDKFDRIVSIEMFEHMRNYEKLLSKVASMLVENGKLFVHIFCHKDFLYPYEISGEADWMTKFFFLGGIMPSKDIFNYFSDDMSVVKEWKVNGTHYSLTSRDWLSNHYKNKKEILTMFSKHYDEANLWFQRWRIFFLTVEEFFKINNGNEWFVNHYLLEKK